MARSLAREAVLDPGYTRPGCIYVGGTDESEVLGLRI